MEMTVPIMHESWEEKLDTGVPGLSFVIFHHVEEAQQSDMTWTSPALLRLLSVQCLFYLTVTEAVKHISLQSH